MKTTSLIELLQDRVATYGDILVFDEFGYPIEDDSVSVGQSLGFYHSPHLTFHVSHLHDMTDIDD